MSIDERQRHELHARLGEVLGPSAAGTLMSYLPPVGWADVATKRDLDALEARIDAKLDAKFQALRGDLLERMNDQTRAVFFAMLASNATLAALAFAAARLS